MDHRYENSARDIRVRPRNRRKVGGSINKTTLSWKMGLLPGLARVEDSFQA